MNRTPIAAALLLGIFFSTLATCPSALAGQPALWDHGVITDLVGASLVRSINDAGQVVGRYRPAGGFFDHAYRWEHGVMTDLGTLGGPYSDAFGINGNGQVVGVSFVNTLSAERDHAFLWDNGVMADLGTLGGPGSRALDINEAGQVVGETTSPFGEPYAFLWERGVMTRVGGPNSFGVHGINDAGQVVVSFLGATGSNREFLWDQGVMVDLGTLGGPGTYAHGINNAGQVVGTSITATGLEHTFLWDHGVMTDLGILGGIRAYTDGINDAGLLIGHLITTSGEVRGFLWENGVMTDLKDFLPVAINNKGQIVGSYDNIDPVPLPPAFFLIASGVAGFLFTSRRSAKAA